MTTKNIALSAMLVAMAAAAPQALGAVSIDAPFTSVDGLATAGDAVVTTGALVYSTPANPYAGATFSGTVETKVYQNDPVNPYVVAGGSGLTFVYHIVSNASSPDPVTRVALDGWGNSPQAFGGNYGATATIDAYNLTRVSANVVDFNYTLDAANGYTMLKGGVSDIVLYSPLSAAVPSTIYFQDGGQGSASTFAPVPEPSTYVAGISALLFGLSAWSKRK